MNRLVTLMLLLLGLATTFVGCSRTVIGGFTDSPDKKYRVYGRVFGALGHAFIDDTVKTVRITIVANDERETLLFRKEYRVKGSDVGYDATWDEHNNLAMVIYDYGPGVQFHGLAKDAPPERHIRTLSYHFDSKAGTFTENAK
jgi:hypothetical protein